MNELFTRQVIDIDAPPRAVWQMLTDPAQTKRYMFGCEARSDWKIGSTLHWVGEHQGKAVTFVVGHVVTFEPGALLRYTTFDPLGALEDAPRNYLTLTAQLTPTARGTRLELSQGDFAKVDKGTERYEHSRQGGDSILHAMKAIAEELGRATSA